MALYPKQDRRGRENGIRATKNVVLNFLSPPILSLCYCSAPQIHHSFYLTKTDRAKSMMRAEAKRNRSSPQSLCLTFRPYRDTQSFISCKSSNNKYDPGMKPITYISQNRGEIHHEYRPHSLQNQYMTDDTKKSYKECTGAALSAIYKSNPEEIKKSKLGRYPSCFPCSPQKRENELLHPPCKSYHHRHPRSAIPLADAQLTPTHLHHYPHPAVRLHRGPQPHNRLSLSQKSCDSCTSGRHTHQTGSPPFYTSCPPEAE